MMKKTAIFLAPAVLGLAGCGGPNCDSNEVKTQISAIAKQNNELTSLSSLPKTFVDSLPKYDAAKDQGIADLENKIAVLRGELSKMDPNDLGNPKRTEIGNSIRDLENQRVNFEAQNENGNAKSNADMAREFTKSITYALTDIIKTAKNSDAGSVECKASLHAIYGSSGNSAPEDITYTVEKTTEGKVVVNVFGLKGY